MDTMLFCPFCGSPIVIPEQDEAEVREVQPPAKIQPQPKKPAQALAEEKASVPPAVKEEIATEEEDEDDAYAQFIPLDMNSKLWQPAEEKPSPKENDVSGEVSEILSRQLQEQPVRLKGLKPDLSVAHPHGAPKIASRKGSDTFVPQRQFNPDDIFMDSDEDEYEDFEDEDEFEFEDREESSFFIRHIRGFVSLGMFAIVAAVVLGWAFSGAGQQALARAGFAWRAEVYAEVAYEAYQNESYALAGKYYAEAAKREADSYDYANSAGVSYYMANDSLNAEKMARLAISIDPTRADAYEILLRLYPDASLRPLEIQGLIQSGYQLSGSESLNTAQ